MIKIFRGEVDFKTPSKLFALKVRALYSSFDLYGTTLIELAVYSKRMKPKLLLLQ